MILAIDPGTTESAYVLYDEETRKPIRAAKVANDELLAILSDVSDENIRPRIVIEMVASYGQPVGADVFETCVWIGRIVQHARLIFGEPIPAMLYRTNVKMYLCHKTAKINDAIIRQVLIDRFGPGKEKAIGKKKTPGPLFGIVGDQWAALALAVTFADRQFVESLSA